MTSGKRLLSKVAPFSLLLRGISHPYRLAILYILAHDPASAEYLSRYIPIRQNLMVHHLKAMHAAGWLRKYRQGRYIMFALQKKAFKELPKLLIGTPFWDDTHPST